MTSQLKDIPNGVFASWTKLIAALLMLPAIFTWGVLIERRVTSIEANRFTSKDGQRLYERLDQKADKSDVPPPEVVQRLQRIEQDIAELKQLIREMR